MIGSDLCVRVWSGEDSNVLTAVAGLIKCAFVVEELKRWTDLCSGDFQRYLRTVAM